MAFLKVSARLGAAPCRKWSPILSSSRTAPDIPVSWDSTRRMRRSSTSPSGALLAIISRICVCPSRRSVRQPALGNVAGNADHADDLVPIVAQGNLGREDPRLLARGAEDAFLHVDHGSPGANDLLFVGEEFVGDVRGKELEVGFADQVGGPRKAHPGRRHLVANDEAAFGVFDPEVVGQQVDQGLQRKALVRRRAPGLQFGDVSGDADQTEDFIPVIAQRHFRRQDPLLGAGRFDDQLFPVDHRLSAAQDILLDRTKLTRGFWSMEVKVGQADHVACSCPTAIGRQGLVDDDETALGILHPQIIGHPVDQGLQREVLALNWTSGLESGNLVVNGPPPAVWRRPAADLSGPLVRHWASGLKFGYVVVSGQPPAVGRRPLADLNGPPIRDPAGPGSRRSFRAGRTGMREKDVDGGRGGPGGDAQVHDFGKRRARTHPLGRYAVDLAIAAIAQNEPLIGVEKANALRDIVDRRLAARGLRFERCDSLPKVVLMDFKRGGRRSLACGCDQRIGRPAIPRFRFARKAQLHSPDDWSEAQLAASTPTVRAR